MLSNASVLDIFKTITTIPRESGNEGPITAFLKDWAERRGLECKVDAIGNVCISKAAAPGKESIPTVVLQAHQDMVCEKIAGSSHNFLTDPIEYEIEDGWMIAKDTTLGADDGIGIAACLALLESDLQTGRLECVFTISEETGMDGANAMQEGFFSGKTLINLDSEDEGELFIGCAGGENTDAFFNYATCNVRDQWTRLSLKVDGALGGHSGDDINKGRANAVQILSAFLAQELPFGIQLLLIKGGGKSNAIARDAEAIIAVPDSDATLSRFVSFGQRQKVSYAESDPGLRFTASYSFFNEKAVEDKACESIVKALSECPHGVIAMSPDIEGLVQTSTNLAAVSMKEKGRIKVVTSQRSSVTSELDEIVGKVAGHFKSCGADAVESFSKYPGWNPNIDSNILKVSVDSYRRLFGVDPKVKAIHAGLECGLFLEKFPGLDMISFGPTLRGVHAPGERMELSSLEKFIALLEDVVCSFK